MIEEIYRTECLVCGENNCSICNKVYTEKIDYCSKKAEEDR